MEFHLLGGISVVTHGGALDLGPARQRCVLAALAVDAGHVVSVDRLIDRTWGEHPPQRARTTLMGYLSRLRRVLADVADTTTGAAVVRRPGGYALECEPSLVDLHRFHELCIQARATADDEQTAALLEQALDLWHGEALTGVEGDWAAAERDRLHQQRLDAEHDLTDVLLRLGHGEDLVASLSARTAHWPLDERVAGQFMLALHRAGRTADALAHYRRLRDRLVEQLGADPGTALQTLHQRILDTDPALTPPSALISSERAARAEEPVLRQLPAPPRWFTGRGTELACLDEALTAEPDEGPPSTGTGSGTRAATVVISALGGAGGIGKTWLALRWAHRNVGEFPDGQLFVDLRGFNPTEQSVTPDAALFGFLTALGIGRDRVPTDLDTKAALYRGLVADKRMLIVLDNAATVDQVIPLLPGSPTCTVLVTGRTRLASLIDRHGARHLQLDVLARTDARALLAARIGADRVAGEPDAVDELVELCGGYPLALSITARNAATRPGISLAEVAAEVRELGLEVLEHDTDPAASLPAVLSWSLRRLTDTQRTVFGLLGIAPGPDITLPAVVSLTGLPSNAARRALSALEEVSLLDRRPRGRYAMHDLVRAYAAATAHDLDEPVREAAQQRVVDFYLHTAFAADRLLNPYRPPIRIGRPVAGVHPEPLPDGSVALTWLDIHHPHLLAAQRVVAARHPQTVWHLAWTLTIFHRRRGRLHDDLAVWQAALRAADHLPDPTSRIHAHRFLGSAHTELEHHEQAIAHLHQAIALAEHEGDRVQQAHTHLSLATAWQQQGDARQALDHARRALVHFRALDQPVWEAEALNLMGWHAAHLGEHDMARAHCQAALVLLRRHDDPHGEAAILDSLGYIDHHSGHHHQAIHHYRQALTLYRSLGHSYEVANTLDNLGHPHAALDHQNHAREAWREALELYRDQGRDTDAERVQRQLDALDTRHHNVDQPSQDTGTAN